MILLTEVLWVWFDKSHLDLLSMNMSFVSNRTQKLAPQRIMVRSVQKSDLLLSAIFALLSIKKQSDGGHNPVTSWMLSISTQFVWGLMDLPSEDTNNKPYFYVTCFWTTCNLCWKRELFLFEIIFGIHFEILQPPMDDHKFVTQTPICMW